MTTETPKTVVVRGEMTVSWTVTLPVESRHIGMLCKDPAVEAAMEAVPQNTEVFLWGETMAPAQVFLEVDERDAEAAYAVGYLDGTVAAFETTPHELTVHAKKVAATPPREREECVDEG